MRPIDADALIEKCGGWYVEEGTESGFIGTLKNLLATEPTIQPEKAQLSQEGTTSEQTIQSVATDTNVGDTISRQAAIDALQNCRKLCVDPFDSYHIDIQDAENQLSKVPTIQPERKKGEWIEISSINHTYKCSECGRLLVNVADGRNNVSKHYPYCHCGADMRGE